MTTATFDIPVGARKSSSTVGIAVALLLPIALVNAIGFILPVLNLARMSFNEALPGGGIAEAFTAANWTGLLQDGFYIELITNSIVVSLGNYPRYPVGELSHCTISSSRVRCVAYVLDGSSHFAASDFCRGAHLWLDCPPCRTGTGCQCDCIDGAFSRRG